ncbi:MAG TPA: AI-2E family transporter [Erythrobacter sp.]|nr:AI-2E family transporter [Erythrobacter sp.]
MAADGQDGDARFVRRVLIVLGIGAATFIAFVLRDLLILVFGSIVIGVFLTAITDLVVRFTKIKRGLALAIAILAVLGLVAGAGIVFRTQIMGQAQQLSDQVPAAWEQARGTVQQWGIDLPDLDLGSGQAPEGDAAQAEAEAEQREDMQEGALDEGGGLLELDRGLAAQISALLTSVFGAVAYTLLVIAGGIYLAAQPKLYRAGILYLFPKTKRPLMRSALNDTGKAIKLWLLGTLFSMGLIGVLTWLGLWLLGVPSPVALGLLAGLLEFVPIIGPIAAAVPAILIAFTQSMELALWTLGLFVVIQQIEGNVVQPMVQKYAVDLPPALLLFSVVAGGYLFGIVGVLFAAPLTVATYVLVRRLYVVEALDTELQETDET